MTGNECKRVKTLQPVRSCKIEQNKPCCCCSQPCQNVWESAALPGGDHGQAVLATTAAPAADS
jgi:hypothetical protein